MGMTDDHCHGHPLRYCYKDLSLVEIWQGQTLKGQSMGNSHADDGDLKGHGLKDYTLFAEAD